MSRSTDAIISTTALAELFTYQPDRAMLAAEALKSLDYIYVQEALERVFFDFHRDEKKVVAVMDAFAEMIGVDVLEEYVSRKRIKEIRGYDIEEGYFLEDSV